MFSPSHRSGQIIQYVSRKSMTPILATDYGNLWAFLIGAPALLLALLLAALAAGFRARWLHVIACLISLFAGFEFFSTLPDAVRDARLLTKLVGSAALALALATLLAAIFTRPRPASAANRKSS
jgi:hypothetical protein